MLTIPTTDKDYAIIRNINDTLLWYRVSDGIWKIINAARAGFNCDFEPEIYYHGLSASFYILGINQDDKLCDALDDIFCKFKEQTDEKKSDKDELSSMKVAEAIYAEWLAYLKEYALSNLKPVA